MHNYPTLTIIWLVLLLATAVVMVCRGTVTQHETDQLWLSDEDTMSLNNREHHRLLRVVAILKPMYQVLLFATVAMSGVIAGIYVVQVWPYVHILPQH
jgi:hypothetical protein